METIKELSAKIEQIKQSIKEKIISLPDNSDIKRINANCFIVQRSKLSVNSWGVEYYDFKYCYTVIADIIEKTEPINIEIKIKEMIKNGWALVSCYNYQHPYRIILNPRVIEHLKTLI